MIDYSLAARLSKPSVKTSEKKVYANAQAREVVTLGKFARHIAEHGSPYTRDVIVGVITAMVDCLREQLLMGNKVEVGEMGAFYVTFSSTGVEDADEFNPQLHIKNVNVRWDRGKGFGDLKQEAEFNYVASRKEQALARKQEKQNVNEALSSSGENTDGGNQADPGDVTP